MVQPSSIISPSVAVGCGSPLLGYLLLLLASSSCCSSQLYDHVLLNRIANSIQNLTDSVTAQERTSEKLASGLMKMFSFLTSEYRHCDEGWLKREPSCYFLSKNTSTWQEARDKCIAMGSDLVKVTTDEEYKFLQDRVKGYSNWVGLADMDAEGTYIWTDGTVHALIKSWWSDGEPNNSEEKCIHYVASNDHRWNDINCNYTLRYICEKSLYLIES